MSFAKLLVLIAVFFLTSLVSVVTGSTSLITVPVLIAAGIETHVAIATNMLALTFLSAGGSIPYIGKEIIDRRRLPLALVLTVAGSILGALVMLKVPAKAVQLTLAVVMVLAAALILIGPKERIGEDRINPARITETTGLEIRWVFYLRIWCNSSAGNLWWIVQRRLRHHVDCRICFLLWHDVVGICGHHENR